MPGRIQPEQVAEFNRNGWPESAGIRITVELMQSFAAPMYNRNPKLQFAFGGTKLVEGRGLGMKTLMEAAGKHGLPAPKYSFDGVYLNLTIFRSAQAAMEATGSEILSQLIASERAGWEWLLARGSAKSSDYVAGMQVGERTARRHLNRFLKLGLVTKSGIGPSTEYEIP